MVIVNEQKIVLLRLLLEVLLQVRKVAMILSIDQHKVSYGGREDEM